MSARCPSGRSSFVVCTSHCGPHNKGLRSIQQRTAVIQQKPLFSLGHLASHPGLEPGILELTASRDSRFAVGTLFIMQGACAALRGNVVAIKRLLEDRELIPGMSGLVMSLVAGKRTRWRLLYTMKAGFRFQPVLILLEAAKKCEISTRTTLYLPSDTHRGRSSHWPAPHLSIRVFKVPAL